MRTPYAASGERLTCGPRGPRDFFHSRLAVSPDGQHLLSAGWAWSPLGLVSAHDLEAATPNPSLHVPNPVTALHGDGTRVAVAVEKGIAVLELPRARQDRHI
ncbi:hypothetical protein [Streptomyces sp. NPDC096339]|uniref:hypothetical protein n=1 Tax=Streptomyces sp. NPDC096339 TaxID=3366086 RepID=UPI0037F3E4D7